MSAPRTRGRGRTSVGGYQYRTPSAKFLALASCSRAVSGLCSPRRVLGDASGRDSGVVGLDCHYRSVLLDPGATGWNMAGRGLEPTGTARTKMARSTSSRPSRRQTNHDSIRDGLSVGRGQAMASTGSRPLRCARMSVIALWVAQQAHCVDGMVRKAAPCISAMGQASAGRFGSGRSQRALATRLAMNWFDAVCLMEISFPRKESLPCASDGLISWQQILAVFTHPFPPFPPIPPNPNHTNHHPKAQCAQRPPSQEHQVPPSPIPPLPPGGQATRCTPSPPFHHKLHSYSRVTPPLLNVTPTNGNPPNVCGRGRSPRGPARTNKGCDLSSAIMSMIRPDAVPSSPRPGQGRSKQGTDPQQPPDTQAGVLLLCHCL